MTPEEKKQIDDLAAQVKDLTAKNANFTEQVTLLTNRATKAETDLKAANDAAAKQALDSRKSEFSEFVNGLQREGRVPPAHHDAIVNRMEREFKAGQTADFAETAEDKKPLALYKAELSTLPVQLTLKTAAKNADFAESSKSADEECQEIADAAKEKMKAAKKNGEKLSAADAVAQVKRERAKK